MLQLLLLACLVQFSDLHYKIHLVTATATDHPSVHHSMDVWHKAKLLKKVLTNVSDSSKHFNYLCCSKAGKMRGMHKIALWSQNIVNHFWYCCRKCGGDRIELKVYYYYL